MTFLTVLRPKVSTENSTTSTLLGGATFTGIAENVVDYATITVFVYTNVSGSLSIQFSIDGTNWDHQQVQAISAGVQAEFSVEVIAKYFRLVYTNGGTNQTVLRLTSLLNPYKSSSDAIVNAITNNGVALAPTLLDAFGRVKVSNPETLMEHKFLTNKIPLRWDELVTGTSTATIELQIAYLNLKVGANTDRVVRQSRLYAPYQPGKALQIFVTGTLELSGGVSGVRSRIGYFDDATDKTQEVASQQYGNGYFFELDGTTLYVVERSFTSGILPVPSPKQTDNRVAQSSWNIDKMDGTGPSGITIDISKRQIFYIELEWLGVGSVLMGLIVNRQLYFVHAFYHANIGNAYPYMCRPTLPVRYEIAKTSAAVGSGTLVQVCSTVLSDGGFVPVGLIFSAVRATDLTISTTEKPLISMRLKSATKRTIARLLSYNLLTDSGGQIIYKIYRIVPPNGAVLSGVLTWLSVNPDSAVEYNENATGFSTAGTNYEVLQTGFASTQSRGAPQGIDDRFAFVLSSDIAGNSDIIVITAYTYTGNVKVSASIDWQEVE